MKKQLFLIIALTTLSACGSELAYINKNGKPTQNDGQYVVHGHAEILVNNNGQDLGSMVSSGNTTVTYSNAVSTNFTINVSALAPSVTPTFNGDILNLGTVSVASLSDNNLKVCGSGSNQKCNQAIIRVYNTGSIAGFINSAENYSTPVFAGTLNPTNEIGLTAQNSVQVQLHTIPTSQHKIKLAADFPSASYAITSDFSNAGVGAYTMVLVIEYALSQ